METDLGIVKDCDNCEGKGIVGIELCEKCEGHGQLEMITVVKTVAKPYGECKYPEIKLDFSEKRGLLTEKEGDEHPEEKGDLSKRIKKLVEIALEEEREKDKKKRKSKLSGMAAPLGYQDIRRRRD